MSNKKVSSNSNIQKERRNEKARKRYSENKAFIERYNLASYKDKHGKRVTPKSSKADIKKAYNRYKSAQRKTDKFNRLKSAGYSDEDAFKYSRGRNELSFKTIEKIQYEKRQRNKISIEDVVREIKPKAFCIGYRDFSENVTISEIYSYSAYLTKSELMRSLISIINKKPSYSKKAKSSSSGLPGDYKYHFGSIKACEQFPNLKKCDGYSFFTMNGSTALHTFTLYNMAVLINSVLNSITENLRAELYRDFYSDICSVIPDAKNYFPQPPTWY